MNIKICGLSREEDIAMANRFLPNYIGFVFYPSSKRYVAPERAAELKAKVDARIKVVGVFVNEKIHIVQKLCDSGVIDVIQLHGDEDLAYINELKAVTEQPIIKAVRVKNAEEILLAAKLPCDYLLLDTYCPGEYGGSGRTFDHRIIPPITKPYFLAGGLNGKNLGKAAKNCKAFALDVSSGCETDGVKDELKFMGIVALAKLL